MEMQEDQPPLITAPIILIPKSPDLRQVQRIRERLSNPERQFASSASTIHPNLTSRLMLDFTGRRIKNHKPHAGVLQLALYSRKELYCYRPEHLIFHRHLLRSNVLLDLANLLQVGFDLRNTLERKILSPKIKASGR